MSLVLLYLVVLVLVGIVLFAIGSVLFGRGEQLPPLPRATTATVLPASGVTGADVDGVKFTQTVRGYKVSEVDWVLDRLGQELDQLRGELDTVRAAHGLDESDEIEHRPAHALPDESDDESDDETGESGPDAVEFADTAQDDSDEPDTDESR